MRLIDADEYRKCLIEHMTVPWERAKYDISDDYNKGLYDAARMLNIEPTITPEPHWIPVTERLPYAEYGESNNVLATCGYRDVEDGSIRWIKTLYFNGGNWCYPTGETYLEKVYAWMPLPEPFKEVTE